MNDLVGEGLLWGAIFPVSREELVGLCCMRRKHSEIKSPWQGDCRGSQYVENLYIACIEWQIRAEAR